MSAPVASGITTEIMAITPEMAEKWLGKNLRNRRVIQRIVSAYAGQMRRGEWLLTGEGIKFSADGSLIDGQHRLLAIIESGKTIRIMVLRGLAVHVQDVLDTGRRRSAGDQLHIRGYENSSALAAAAKLVILYETGRFYVDAHLKDISHREILDYVEGNSLLAFAVSRGTAIGRGSELRPAVAAASFYLLMKLDDEAAVEFFDRLSDGVNLSSRDPVLALRARLQNLRRDHANLPNEVLFALVFRTWNAWRGKRLLTSLPVYKDGGYITCPVPK